MYERMYDASLVNVNNEYLEPPYLPVEVDDVTLAFPARVGHLMPKPHDIPEEFWRGRTTWNNFMNAWFAGTLPSDVGFLLKEGIDGNLMMRHLRSIMGSFQPKHEHKEAAVAYLCSLWLHAVVLDSAALYGEIPADWPTTEVDEDEEEK